MGIKNFSKAFQEVRIVRPRDLKGMTIAMDALSELMRAALGAKSVTTLTDSSGKPTIHISVILSNILEFYRNGVNQIWVFDHEQDPNADFHNPAKLDELIKRRKKREDAKTEMMELINSRDTQNSHTTQNTDHETFDINLDEIDTKVNEKVDAKINANKTTAKSTTKKQHVTDRIKSLEKRVFKIDKDMINDIKLILNCLGIKYIESPAGFEGEGVASYLTNIGKADAVYSGDTDPIAYGAKVLLRRNPRDKKVYEYTLENIIQQIDEKSSIENPTIDDIRKAAIMLGTDVSPKTPGIGAATVLKKLHEIKLTAKQKKAIKEFEKVPDEKDITIYNETEVAFGNKDRIKTLIDWLVDVKSFNRTRIQTQFDKALIPLTKKKVKVSAIRKTNGKAETSDSENDSDDNAPESPVKSLPPKRVNGKVVAVKKSSD